MYKSFIRRKLGYFMDTFSTKYAYIQYMPTHKSSEGALTPYVVKSHKDNKVLSSYENREGAKNYLISTKVHASFTSGVFLPEKNKEIIVHLRMQKGKDKQQLIDYMSNKFNLLEHDAERLFYEAFPDGLDFQEEESLDTLENILVGMGGVPVEFLESVFNSCLSKSKEDSVYPGVPPIVKDNVKIVVSSLLRRRGFI